MNRQLAAIIVVVSGLFTIATLALLLVDPHIVGDIGIGAGPEWLSTLLGLAFWTGLCLLTIAAPVEMPRGAKIGSAIIPVLGAAFLGGPLAGAFVAFVGSTEKRELTGEVPWYGVLTNHASLAGSAIIAGLLYHQVTHPLAGDVLILDFVGAIIAGIIAAGYNALTGALVVSRRSDRSLRGVITSDFGGVYIAFCALVPFAWMFIFLYTGAGPWAAALAALPLYVMRTSNKRFVEMRETFVQAISALAHALDARDVYTAGHSHRMSEVAVDIAKVMNVSDNDIEQLEWAGILHDVGKIGVPDRVLLKQGRLDDEERAIIESHPVIGALIVEPVNRLAPEVPLIRHHHERWDGQGYPDGLAGEAIPPLARILAVADSFDAMTAQRPYRMNPLTPEEAYAEIIKCSGSQFDPTVVEAFGKTKWARGEYDRSRGNVDPRFADVDMVSGSARHVDHQRHSDVKRRSVRVEFVDPHGDAARAKALAEATALNAQAMAAAELAVRRGHGHQHFDAAVADATQPEGGAKNTLSA